MSVSASASLRHFSLPVFKREGLKVYWQLAAFAVCAALIFSRRPDAFLNPQFFGEDGSIWFPDAYLRGWFISLFHPLNGYFQTLPRLAAALALVVPFRFAPLIENLIGLTVQILPVVFLLSPRCRNLGSLGIRLALAAIYIGLPDSRELDVAIEEGQWHLALLACLVLLACAPQNRLWRIFDFLVLVVCGLSGPFAIMLWPLTILRWWSRRERWLLVSAGVLAVCAGVQFSSLATTAAATRPKVGLGATPKLFIQLLGGNVYLGALLGSAPVQAHRRLAYLIPVALAGTALIAYLLLKSRLEWKLLIAFCLLVFAASLRNPMVSMSEPQWPILREAFGIRYWFFPTLGFCWTVVWAIGRDNPLPVRSVAVGLLLFIVLNGTRRDWVYAPYPDLHFQQHAAAFAAAPHRAHVTIPICPPGWNMELIKK